MAGELRIMGAESRIRVCMGFEVEVGSVILKNFCL